MSGGNPHPSESILLQVPGSLDQEYTSNQNISSRMNQECFLHRIHHIDQYYQSQLRRNEWSYNHST